jgi:Family of unknown function (DUF5906)
VSDDTQDSVGQTDVTAQQAQAVLRLRELAALAEIPAPALLADLFPAAGTSLQELIESDTDAVAAATQARREAEARRAAARDSAVTEPAPDYVYPSREHAEAAITRRFGMLNDSGVLSVWDSLTKTELSIVGFNAEWGRHMPEEPGERGSNKTTYRPPPFNILKNSPDRHSCRGIRFEPGADRFFVFGGVEYANSYKGHPTDERPTAGDREAQRAARVLVKFARHLFPRPKFGSLNKNPFFAQLLAMHAFLYRHPHKRIFFAMVLGGEIEGSGKTQLMKGVTYAVHGKHNTVTVGSRELFSDFNSYEGSHRFGIMDELQVCSGGGKEKFDGLKTSISERDLRVVKKGKDGADVNNHISWLGTTNHPLGAIPLADTARRFWLEETPAERMPDHLAAAVDDLLVTETPTEPGGIGGAVLRAYLRARYDAAGFRFNQRAKPPQNEALQAAKRAQISREQELLEEALNSDGVLSRGFGTVLDLRNAIRPLRSDSRAEHISEVRLWRLFGAAAKARGFTVVAQPQSRSGDRGRYRYWYRDDADLRRVRENLLAFRALKASVNKGQTP